MEIPLTSGYPNPNSTGQSQTGLDTSIGFENHVEAVALKQRNCDQEQIDCFRRCWKRKPPYPRERNKHDHYEYCQETCLKQYMECLKATGQQPLEFRGMNEAIDWLKRHRKPLLVGSIIISASLAFVVVSAAGGVLILAPIALF